MAKGYQFNLELRDSKPQIWRTIHVDQKMTVTDFCYIVLVVFEMEASHLFKVIVPVGQMQMEKYNILKLLFFVIFLKNYFFFKN